MVRYHCVILGGGYAGLMCATRLAGRMKGCGIRAALVNDAPAFVERLRLHESLADPRFRLVSRLPALGAFFDTTGVDFVEARVVAIARPDRRVVIDGGQGLHEIAYDHLVIALGSQTDTLGVAGVAENAFSLDPTGARGQPELKRRLVELARDEPRLIVVGGGATGIEVAGELAAVKGSRVSLLEAGRFAAFAAEPVRVLLRRALERAGVEIAEHRVVRSVEPDHVMTDAGVLCCDLCVWCGGFRGRDVVRESGLDVDGRGRVLVDPYLRSLSDPAVHAVGDACLPVEWHGAPPRMSAFFALVTGAHAADTIAAVRHGRRPRPLGFWTWGQAIAVGREAVGFATIPYDRQVGPVYRGRTAFLLRAFFVWLLAKLLLIVQRFPRLRFWLGRGAFRRDAVAKYMPPAAAGARHE